MSWAAIAFGWPAAILSILAGFVGVVSREWKWVMTGALIGCPFLLYLTLTPRFGWVSALVALSYAGAVVASFRRRPGLAWLFFMPMLALVVFVAWAVAASQPAAR